MFNLYKEETTKKINKLIESKNSLVDEKNAINKSIIDINNLLIYKDDIRSGLIEMLLVAFFSIASGYLATLVFRVGMPLLILSTMAILGSVVRIADDRKVIKGMNYKGSLKYKNLLNEKSSLENQLEYKKALIKTKEQALQSYYELNKKIDAFDQDKCTDKIQLYNLLEKHPILAFDDIKEYNSFCSKKSEDQELILKEKVYIKK